eukprot:CAMPEP_0182892712 /NCGR_PEP_ID=MMETSP0034_2-20130328/24032_1 /TAXON_ID=156128 /ORGANISM="Nephroselmis pyriformis, Strain CCMP717" /LENGTH=368 /DNA_ID=CAMNT_0025026411 /DNA_START=136 /DNA_END=1242 /DNA_ORIENTATION=+
MPGISVSFSGRKISVVIVYVACMIAHAWGARPGGMLVHRDERLIGWKGEMPSDMPSAPAPSSGSPEPPIVISWENPRAFLYKGLLTPEECAHIKALAEAQLERSSVVSNSNGGSVLDNIRTSSGTFLQKRQDAVVSAVEKRIAKATSIPESHQEALQVLRYQNGEKYEPHFDYFFDRQHAEAPQGNRLATMLMYLETTEGGGETVFPNSAAKPEVSANMSACAARGLHVKPTLGDAILFWDMRRVDGGPYTPDAGAKLDQRGVPAGWALDPSSLHGACPVTKGIKWSAPMWMHPRPWSGHFSGEETPSGRAMGSGACKDEFDMCREWALKGECETNPAFMIGTGYMAGTGGCIKSCNRCNANVHDEGR